MKEIKELVELKSHARGAVSASWVSDSKVVRLPARANQLSYACADAMAMAFAGNQRYIPRYVGFVYGAAEAPVGLTPATSRDQTWAGLAANLAEPEVVGNIQIAPLSLTPALGIDGDPDLYSSNAVTFSAHTRTDASATYGFPLAAPYAEGLSTGSYLYHAVLLAMPSQRVYVPVARVTLADAMSGAYLQKPDGFELAVEWQVSFF